MHETSIINSVARTLEMEFGEERLNSLERIFLKVGILSNIEPRLLMNAFEAFQQTYPTFSKVSLEIESTPLVIHCSSCDVDSEVQNYKFICKSCGAPSKEVIQSEEMLIHKVEFNDD